MALIEVNTNPSDRELRYFAGIWLPALCGILGGLVWCKASMPSTAVVIWSGGGVLGITGLLRPAVLRPVFVGWMYAVFPIGWTTGHLLLAMVFYLVITPIALIMRTRHLDPLERKLDPSARTYWTPHRASQRTRRYFQQF